MRRLAVLLVLVGCSGVGEEIGVMPGIVDVERELQDPENCTCDTGTSCPGSPIVLDLNGNGWNITNLDNGVRFDLRPGGELDLISWTAAGADDAWLTLDRNGNGTIDDGSELFGNFTEQPENTSPNGYRALAVFDLNHDHKITAADTVYNKLRLWRDANHDGVSQPGEFATLASVGVTGLSTDFTEHKRADAYGNLFRYSAAVYKASGSRVNPLSFDVYLLTVAFTQKAQELNVPAYAVAPQEVCNSSGCVKVNPNGNKPNCLRADGSSIGPAKCMGCGGGGGNSTTNPACVFTCIGYKNTQCWSCQPTEYFKCVVVTTANTCNTYTGG